MYIGSLKVKSVSFVHPNTNVSFPPDLCEDGRYTWHWNTVFDSVLDACYTLEAECFVGVVVLELSKASVKKVEIIVDDVLSGAYCAESGKTVGGTIQIPVGVKGHTVTVRLYADLIDLSICSIELLGARDDGEPFVYPTPKTIEFSDGYVEICDIVSKSGDADEMFAAKFLKERLTETLGEWQSTHGVVIVVEKTDDVAYEGERYTVRTELQQITIRAGTRLSLLYGCDTILQLYARDRGVRRFQCDDRPTKTFRGFHMGLPHLKHFDFIKRLLRYVLLPLRYNTVLLEITASMRFESHPEITEAWQRAIDAYKRGEGPMPPHMHAGGMILEKTDVATLADAVRELGFEIIPEVQSLGHVQYITLAHPEIAEIDETVESIVDTRSEDIRPSAQFHHCYCPSAEESYRIIFDLIDEIVAVTRPQRYVHIGHDEIYQIGVCKRCREKDHAELLATHVKRLYDYLAKKGLGTMMWSDMLQPPPISNYRTYRASDLLPRDIVMLDFIWYFNMDRDIEDTLLEKGYSVAVGNLYSSHYPRYRSRVMKERVLGGQISMWVDSNEETIAENGKLWDCIYLSEMLWNTEGYDERNRRTYSHRISRELIPKMRDEVRARVSPNGYRETLIRLPEGQKPSMDILSFCPDAVVLQGETIRVDATFERLVFEHATLRSAPRIMWRPIDKIGDYCITYSDGTVWEEPVKYAANIMAYNTAHGTPLAQEYYRHNGYVGTWLLDPAYTWKSADGSDMTIGGFLWENPYPEKKIAHITYRSVQNDYCGLILAGIRGLCKK